MAKKGYEHATITAIAKQAGLASGLIHYHFADKQEILVVLVERLASGLESRVASRLRTAGPSARSRLHALVEAHVGLGDDADPNAVAAWVVVAAEAIRQKEVRALYTKALASTLARLESLVRDALAEEGRSTRSAKHLAAALLAAVEGAFLVHVSAPGVLPPGYAAPALRALVDGVLDA